MCPPAKCLITLSLSLSRLLMPLSHDYSLGKLLPSRNWGRFSKQNGRFSTSTDQKSWSLPPRISIVQKIQEAVEKEDCLCDESSALQVLNDLQVRPYHVNEVLKGLDDARSAYKVFEWAKSLPGFKHDKFNYTLMIGIIGKSGNANMAKHLFEEMLSECCHADIFAFNNLLKTYASANRQDEVLALFRNLKKYGCQPDMYTFTIVIDSLGKNGRLSEAKAIYKAMQRAGWQPDKYVFNSLICNLGKWGYVSSAMKCFEAMKRRGFRPSSITYSTLIYIHSKGSDIVEALGLYREYQASKLERDLVVYNSIMYVLGKCGRTIEAEWVYLDIEKAGLCADVYTYCILVSSWGREGDALEAQKWFEKMLQKQVAPNVPVCNALIHAYRRAEMFTCVGDVLFCMREKWGLVPTLQTYTALLSFYTDCKEEHSRVVRNLMLKACHPAHNFVDSILSWKGQGNDLKDFARACFLKMQVQAFGWTKCFANVVVNYLYRHGHMFKAHHVWEAALESKLYPQHNIEQNGNCWNILLLDMEGGTALVALTKTLILCKRKLGQNHTRIPARVLIITGQTKHRASRLFEAVDDMLHHLNSPFRVWFDTGKFICDGKDFKDWLEQPFVETKIASKEHVFYSN